MAVKARRVAVWLAQARKGSLGEDGLGSDRTVKAWQSWMGLARIVQTRNGSHGEAWQAEAWTGCARSGRNESIGKE